MHELLLAKVDAIIDHLLDESVEIEDIAEAYNIQGYLQALEEYQVPLKDDDYIIKQIEYFDKELLCMSY